MRVAICEAEENLKSKDGGPFGACVVKDGKIELTNVFSTSSNNLNSTNSDIVTINIEGETGVNGNIDITAFIDINKVAITDTYLNETDEDWVMGREVLTTEEWNNFASTPLSFKVKVEANEGTFTPSG